MAHIQKKVSRSSRTGKKTIRWQARYLAPDGRERSKRFDRRVDAEAWLAVRTAEVTTGAWIDPRAGKVSFADFATRYLDDRTDLRSTTRAKYDGLLKRHLLPEFGSVPLAQVNPSQVRAWWAKLNGTHPSTAAGAYRLLSSIFNAAVNDEKIAKSPCRVKGAATERSPERPLITIAELEIAIEAAPRKYKIAIELGAWCQLRRAEILGLQRHDVNLLHGTITIRRTWTQRSSGGYVLGPPKSEAGVRTITMPENVQRSLQEHLNDFVSAERDAWVFAGANGEPVSPRTIDRVWNDCRRKAGRPDVRFHDLRHAGLTWAAGTGASTAELMLRGGHASPTAALRYQHATADRDRVLADALADLAQGRISTLRRTGDGQAHSETGATAATHPR
jgi:integrase